MVAEGAVVEDALGALVVLDCGVAEVDSGFGGAGGEFSGVFVKVVEVVLGNISQYVSIKSTTLY